MYSIEIDNDIVLSSGFVDATTLLPHELVVTDRMHTLAEYLKTLKPYVTVPSILVCNKTNMIIDGHHRFYALQKLGFDKMPVTWINYDSDKIITDLVENPISKKELIDSAVNKDVLNPKSSFHHIVDVNGDNYPIILLSVLFKLDFN